MLRNLQRGFLNLSTIYFEDMPVPEKKIEDMGTHHSDFSPAAPFHQVFHSARDLRAWLERGEGDGEEVFTNRLLRERRCKVVVGRASCIYRQQTWSRLQYRIG